MRDPVALNPPQHWALLVFWNLVILVYIVISNHECDLNFPNDLKVFVHLVMFWLVITISSPVKCLRLLLIFRLVYAFFPIIELYEDEPELISTYESKNGFSSEFSKDGNLVTLTLSKDIRLITPGVTNFLGNPIHIEAERTFYINE